MTFFDEDETSTAVYVHTPTHGAVDYRTAREAYNRVAQGVATGSDIRLVAYLIKFLFRKAQ